MQRFTTSDLAFISRSMSSMAKRPHYITYLLLLKSLKDLSITELEVYMDGVRSAHGNPLTHSAIYNHMRALEKQGLVYHERMVGEEGVSCNVYFLSPLGDQTISPFLHIMEDWKAKKKALTGKALSRIHTPNKKTQKINSK